jgi:hypothetical protein
MASPDLQVLMTWRTRTRAESAAWCCVCVVNDCGLSKERLQPHRQPAAQVVATSALSVCLVACRFLLVLLLDWPE